MYQQMRIHQRYCIHAWMIWMIEKQSCRYKNVNICWAELLQNSNSFFFSKLSFLLLYIVIFLLFLSYIFNSADKKIKIGFGNGHNDKFCFCRAKIILCFVQPLVWLYCFESMYFLQFGKITCIQRHKTRQTAEQKASFVFSAAKLNQLVIMTIAKTDFIDFSNWVKIVGWENKKYN